MTKEHKRIVESLRLLRGHRGKTIESKNKEELKKLMLHEFNWRWKAYLKSEYTQQQFSTGYRKFLKEL